MQSTNENLNLVADFSLVKITEILIKEQRIHEGIYNLAVQFHFAIGAVGPSPESIFPGAMMGISRIGLSQVEEDKTNIHSVNAAEVNPIRKNRTIKEKK